MSNGGYTGNTPARETSPEQYPGVWELTEQFQAQADGNWPFQETDCAPKSLRLNGSNGYLSRAFASAGSRTTWSLSCWIKRANLDTNGTIWASSTLSSIRFSGGNGIEWLFSGNYGLFTSNRFRDPSAWAHYLFVFDSSNSVADDRQRIYLNNELLTAYDQRSNQGLNSTPEFNSAQTHVIGAKTDGSVPLGGGIAEVQFIDGQALTPDAFTFIDGQGVLQPKRFTGGYGQKFPSFTGVTTGGTQFEGPYSNIFDGNPSSRVLTYTTTSTKLTLDSPPAWTNKIEIRALRYGGIFEINGVDISGLAWTANPQYLDATSLLGSSGTLQTIEVGDVGSNYVALYSIKLDGVELIQPATGNNSFHLDFADSSSTAALGFDSSGLGNAWTPHNITASVPSTFAIDFDGNDKVVFPGTTFAGDCTIECFVKSSDYSGIQRIFSANEGTDSGQYTDLRAYNGAHEFYFGTTNYVSDNGTTIPTGVWNHIALTRNGNNVSYYMNGTRLATDTLSGSVLCTSMVLAHGYGSEYFTGQISNARIVNGQALYTGASYTVPTGPLTTTSQGAIASNVTHLLANSSSVTANGGTAGAGTVGGNPTVVSGSTFGSASDIDALVDSPVKGNQTDPSGLGGIVQGNYATWNPLTNSNVVCSDGNLVANTSSNDNGCFATQSIPDNGKVYFEFTCIRRGGGGAQSPLIGVGDPSGVTLNVNAQNSTNNSSTWLYGGNGYKTGGGSATTTYGDAFNAGDVIGVCIDRSSSRIWFSKNNVWQNSGDPTNPTDSNAAFTNVPASGTLIPFYGNNNGTSGYGVINFGASPFNFSAPTGYKTLNTTSLPEPSIPIPSQYFDTKLYTSNASSLSVTGYKFSPSFVWIKNRDTGNMHGLFDVVRGANQFLSSNRANAEHTTSGSGFGSGTFNSFDSNGFTLGNDVGQNSTNYPAGDDHVAWAWNAGEATTTIAAGSLNSSAYDQSQTWSNSLSATFRSTEPATNAFDGDTSTIAGSAGSITYTSPVAVASSSTIRVFVHGGDHNVSVNSGANQTVAAGSFVTVNFTNPTNNTFTITFDRVAGSADSGVRAIEIGGKLLVDNGVSVSNVPSIASTVRSSPESGFSIVSYQGTGSAAEIAHGLNSPPDFIVCKDRDSSSGWWATYISSQGATKGSYLNAGNQAFDAFTFWNNTTPTSSVFSIGANANTNASGDNFIAYCFSNVEGYCKIGQHTNGASGNQAFIYTGFRPAWILGRPITADWWTLYDSKRDPDNPLTQKLWPNVANAEAPQNGFDFLSNGFKCIAADNNFFASSANATWIYIAFAESPFKYARAR